MIKFAQYFNYHFLLILSIVCLSACDYFAKNQLDLPQQEDNIIKNNAYHFEMTQKDQDTYNHYLAKLSKEEKTERENYYCGKLGDKTIKFSKDFLFAPLGYSDISFLEQDGWKAKMRWCNDPIVSYSVVVTWPNLKPARNISGFSQLDWGVYDQYLLKKNKTKNYSDTVIYIFGQLNQFSSNDIKNNPTTLRPYLENLFKKYKANKTNKIIIRQDLNLSQLKIPWSDNKMISVYWHKYHNNQADLVIECMSESKATFSWCRAYFFPKDVTNIIASFIVTEDKLIHWSEMVKQSSVLFDSFVLKVK